MTYINVRGVDHYYEWIKKPSNIIKPVMVFMHGWAGSGRYWQSTAKALLDNFDCLIYDMRGFGRSHVQPDLSYELTEYAEDLAVLLNQLNLERVYINAHSMGASIATLFLNRYPQKVEKAILTCSGIFEYDEKAFAAFYKFGGLVVKFRPKWLGKIPLADRMFMARFLHSPIPKSERQAFLEDFINADYQAALGTIFTSVSKEQAELMPQEFTKLTVPTLLVAGEYDIIIPAELSKKAAALNDKVKLTIVPNTAHFPMLEDAATYLARVRDFLNTGF
ncbi:alpha/beta fold hydrolase [Dolichospermum circinale]|uniref:alpha/beta fold hydrolase n=1 Tax=Dolichospermum circinale TaxID=109265 RepID=UPI00232ACDF6|nr:alpha/beta hydrolase [Dolichospermum circinale]MDB9467401.1 alpha/beta hydrolase [Dolichospermum circinale CS-539/09]MDB9471563.1 alpha/beta hydrolase [Dolichospermum circinale CS-539]